MQVIASNSYNALRFALNTAIGALGKKRPQFLSVSNRTINMRGDYSTYEIEFAELNYDYANKLYLEDISIFNDFEFGKFFLEYGRCLFANLMVCLTKADFNAVNNRDGIEVPYIAEYLDELLKLDDQLSPVLKAFKNTLGIADPDTVNPSYDFSHSSWFIQEYKKSVSMYNRFDMKNTDIFAIAYNALWFSVTGSLLILGKEAGYDAIDQFDPRKTRDYKNLIESVSSSERDDESKSRLISMIFAFNAIRGLFANTAGLEFEDPLLEATGKFTDTFIREAMDGDLINYVDESIITGHADSGISLARFCRTYNPLVEIIEFDMNGVIQNDITNLWAFGRAHYRHYFSPSVSIDESGTKQQMMQDVSAPAIVSYLGNADIAVDNAAVESGFGFLKNIVTGVEKGRLALIDPGLILQLTLIASAFRKAEHDGLSGLSDVNKESLTAGIDLADTIIVGLYKSWFVSGKYFDQVTRQMYCEDKVLSTREILEGEIVDILSAYFEYVRFGVANGGEIYSSDKLLFASSIISRYNESYDGNGDAVTNTLFPTTDMDVFVRECGSHGTRTFAYEALCYEHNVALSVDALGQYATRSPLSDTILKILSQSDIEEYTGVELLDRVISAYGVIKSSIQTSPENFALAVYIVMLDCIDDLFKKNDVGHYFDFNKPENAIGSYKVETMVSDLIKKPMQSFLNLNKL